MKRMSPGPSDLPQTVLAFDVGTRRTGVAYGSRMLGHPQAQPTLNAQG